MPRNNKNKNKKSRADKLAPYQPFPALRNYQSSINTTIFPRKMMVRLPYVETISVSLTAGLASDYLFNLNSLYDPNRTGTGHQPMGFDNWATFYGRYRVDYVDLSLIPLSTTSSTAISIAAVATNSTSVMTQYYQAAEHPGAKSVPFQNNGMVKIIHQKYDLAQINGVPRTVYEVDDRYQAPFTTSPSESIILHCVVEDASQAAVTALFRLQLIFYCDLFDPLEQVLN